MKQLTTINKLNENMLYENRSTLIIEDNDNPDDIARKSVGFRYEKVYVPANIYASADWHRFEQAIAASTSQGDVVFSEILIYQS